MDHSTTSPESRYQGSEPLPKPHPGPTGHSQAGPARLPGTTATGAFIMSCGSERGRSQSRRSHFRHCVPGTTCSSQTLRRVGPPGPVLCTPYHTKFFLGRSWVSETQARARTSQGVVSRLLTSYRPCYTHRPGGPLSGSSYRSGENYGSGRLNTELEEV